MLCMDLGPGTKYEYFLIQCLNFFLYCQIIENTMKKPISAVLFKMFPIIKGLTSI